MDRYLQSKSPATTLVYAVDQCNVNAMLVSLSSALEQSSGLVQVCVLYTGKNLRRLRRFMEGICGDTTFHIINASDELRKFKREKFPTGTIGEIAHLKFLVPQFVETERALFLDADTIVRSDLRELYEQDLQGKPLGAVQDWLVPTVLAKNSPIRQYVDSKTDQQYFNSGVMVMDVARLQEIDLLARAAELRDVKVRYSDQDLFNLLFLGNWASVEPIWNFPIDKNLVDESNRSLHSELWPNRRISHYMGTKKPWIFPFNTHLVNRDFTECRNRSHLRYWIPNPFSPSSLRYYIGFVRRKLGFEF